MRYFTIAAAVLLILAGFWPLSPSAGARTGADASHPRTTMIDSKAAPNLAAGREYMARLASSGSGNPSIDRDDGGPVRTAQYSFCGACTLNSDCGVGNLCCQGDCPTGKKKCYAVKTCP